MSKYTNQEEEIGLDAGDIAILIHVLQDCKVPLGQYPFSGITQLNKTIQKLIKLRERIDNVSKG